MRKHIHFLVFWIASPLLLSAQSLVFENLNTENGLSQNAVLAIAQDHRGFMWFGTNNGLNRYDTREFKVYKHDPGDSHSLSLSYIDILLYDSHHTLWIGTRQGLNRYIPETDNFQRISSIPLTSSIATIYEDRNGLIWVWASTGLFLSDEKQTIFRRIAIPDSVLGLPAFSAPHAFYQDSQGSFWIGSSTGLAKVEFQKDHVQIQTFRHGNDQPHSLSDNAVTSIIEDQYRRLWIGTLHGGLDLYEAPSGSFKHFSHSVNGQGPVSNNIRVLKKDSTGKIWIGTQKGLSILDPDNQQFISYQHQAENKKSLSHNSIYSIFMDHQHTIWLGTYWGGVNSVSPYNTSFQTYQVEQHPARINNNVVSAVIEDHDHNLWVGTEGGGVCYLNRHTNGTTTYQNDPNSTSSLGSDLIKTIYSDKDGNIWIGTHGGGLNLLDHATGHFTHYLYKDNDPVTLGSEVLSVMEDTDKRFWVGTQQGLFLFTREKKALHPLPLPAGLSGAFERTSIYALIETKDNKKWLGTSNGLYCWNGDDHPLARYTIHDGLTTNEINCLYEDRKGNIWIGLHFGGLAFYDPPSGKFTVYSTRDGLADNNVQGILSDGKDDLWISTGNGLSKFNPSTRAFKNYSRSDGLAGNSFNINSCCRSGEGELFFGGYNGLTFFNPTRIEINSVPPSTVITNLKLFDHIVGIDDEVKLLDRDINLTKQITLTYKQNVFTLQFATLNYVRPWKNKYAYKLAGFDQDWNYPPTPSATYMNLPAGDYTFLVKGANNDGIWGEPASLHIRIRPPFWKTIWAYSLYILFIGAILFLIGRFFVMRSLMKRDKELTQFKLNFFTNISHEIRTHLSLISGPVEELISSSDMAGRNTGKLRSIKKNADSLLHLVTELMDFRKVESGSLVLNITQQNIVSFLKEVYTSFHDLAITKNIKTDFIASGENIPLYFDRVQMEKVFSNLLSNSLKFTPPGGCITILIEEKKEVVTITITDNGKGILPENLPKLFTNYFQEGAQEGHNIGYGIGLALAKSIVEYHKGTITVDSRLTSPAYNNKTTFEVTLLKGKEHMSISSIVNLSEASIQSLTNVPHFTQPEIPLGSPIDIPVSGNEAKDTILLVEDNAEIRSFIRESLENYYQVIEAENGRSGWESATEQIPDIIISDVMMPEMDGFTLCEKLKEDSRTSHIPVILLTAMSSTDDQISGLKRGADIYITKPFSIQVLLLQLSNLLKAREKIRDWFNSNFTPLTDPARSTQYQVGTPEASPETPSGISFQDNDFLQNLAGIIEAHLDDPTFNVFLLAKKAAMSHTILYKKLKALTRLSVNDFIKTIRFKKAVELMRKKEYSITEISYMVGFSDRKYFSKEFKKQFGKSPQEYLEQWK